MKKLPVWLLPLFLAGSLSAIYFLPRAGAVAQSAVKMEMPRYGGGWSFHVLQPSEAELKTLAGDTEFSKAICTSPRAYEITDWGDLARDRVDLSIVLSGSDINNSIHRPERCMPAQNHNIIGSSDRSVTLANGRTIPLKRLVSIQSIALKPKEGDPAEKVNYAKFKCLTYYFFIGNKYIGNDHISIRMVDIKDRLVHGVDQRWAYVSASMWYGRVPGIGVEVTEQEADEKLQRFLTDFAERQIDWEKIAN